MESRIAQQLNLKYRPVTVCWTDDKPVGARGFKEGKWACVMWLAAAAAKGETACFDKKHMAAGAVVSVSDLAMSISNSPAVSNVFILFCRMAMRSGRRVVTWQKNFRPL